MQTFFAVERGSGPSRFTNASKIVLRLSVCCASHIICGVGFLVKEAHVFCVFSDRCVLDVGSQLLVFRQQAACEFLRQLEQVAIIFEIAQATAQRTSIVEFRFQCLCRDPLYLALWVHHETCSSSSSVVIQPEASREHRCRFTVTWDVSRSWMISWLGLAVVGCVEFHTLLSIFWRQGKTSTCSLVW